MKKISRSLLVASLGVCVSAVTHAGETTLWIGYAHDRLGAVPEREFNYYLGDGVSGPSIGGPAIVVRHVPSPGRMYEFEFESLSGTNDDGKARRQYTAAIHHWRFPASDVLAVSVGTGLGHFGYRIDVLHEGSPLYVSEGNEVFLTFAAALEMYPTADLRLAVSYDHQESFPKPEMDARLSLTAEWRFTGAWRVAAGYHDDDWSNGTTLSLIHDF